MSSFTFKARMNSLFNLQINTLNVTEVQAAIKTHIAQTPNLFQAMPVVLDVPANETEGLTDFLETMLSFLRSEKLAPMACVQYSEIHKQFAENAQLACLPVGTTFPLPMLEAPKRRDVFLDHSVRSGQQVYAAGDLIVMGSVSAGAELLADGNIHVFGALRGRALAGLRGETHARIFCHSLESELVSIAGIYQLYEHMPENLQKKPVYIMLDGENLHYSMLKS